MLIIVGMAVSWFFLTWVSWSLVSLTPMIAEMGEKHLTYPILYYFHTSQRSRCLPLSVAAFDEAMTLLQYALPANCKPDPASVKPCSSC